VLNRFGKVILPLCADQDPVLDLLCERAAHHGVRVEIIDEVGLAELEPEARSLTGRALYSPDTAVFDPLAILEQLRSDLVAAGVDFYTWARGWSGWMFRRNPFR
jgi:glycine/D-amino acid oxidase-like deaminating enzyme